MLKGDPLVSIRCLVYNHEPYLRQCLDGFVMQKTTFPFEAIVHDDASTDGSAAIIREYAEKYPDIIKPIYETENQFSKGGNFLSRIMNNATHPNSRYIAVCEGDDYWTDPNKLQLQVDFLESHPDYYMTCHGYTYYFQDTGKFEEFKSLEYLPRDKFEGREYCTPSIKDYFNLAQWFTQLLTIVRRRENPFTEEKGSLYKRNYDYISCYYMMTAGKCAVFKDVMGIYRRHGSGVFGGRDGVKWREYCVEDFLTLYTVEKEEHVLRPIDTYVHDVVVENFKRGNVKKALSIFGRYLRIVPFKHFITYLLLMIKRNMTNKIKGSPQEG